MIHIRLHGGVLRWAGLPWQRRGAFEARDESARDFFARAPRGTQLPPGPLALHLDVDVPDFTDAPLAENTDGRNTGPTLDQAAEALTAAARDQRMRALSIGELNPTRCAGTLTRFPASSAASPAYSQPRLTDHQSCDGND
jgi:arginase family enzyme